MVDAAKRLTEANQNENCKVDKEGNKDKDGDNNRTKNSKLVLFAIVNMPSFVARVRNPDTGLLSYLQYPRRCKRALVQKAKE